MVNRTNRKLTKDHAYLELKHQVINGELKPDEIIREEQLASNLEISRTPLREAIQRLEMEDFLIRQTNGRLKVASANRKEMEEIFLIRSMLEGTIARHAAMRATDRDIRILNSIQHKIKFSFQEGANQDFVSYGFEFHDYLGEISQLKTFEKTLEKLRDHSLRYCRLISRFGNWSAQADKEHAFILQKIMEKDPDGAEQAMKDHIFSSLSTAVDKLDRLSSNDTKTMGI
ncbi:GntR family transcriptional regulator [Niallia sp. JL1B1071]|uniref:GntR family transcriptional regulator n=1 Tax=Niallia tiangongensis TaxID=3237105 RepID=UPI0037DD9204